MKRLVATALISLVFTSGIYTQDLFRRLEIFVGPQRPPVEKLDPVCPKLEFVSSGRPMLDGEFVGFIVRLKGGDQTVTPVLLWFMSAGTLIGGQGTHNPVVDTTGASDSGFITAKVIVGGYAPECVVEGTRSVRIVKRGEPRPLVTTKHLPRGKRDIVTGKFIHFLDLDHRYAAVGIGSRVLYLMLKNPRMECFLAAHQGQELAFSYETSENLADGIEDTFSRLTDVLSQTAPISPPSWAAQEISNTSAADHEKHCADIVTKRIANRR